MIFKDKLRLALLIALSVTSSSFLSSCDSDDDDTDTSTQALNRKNKEAGENFLMENRKVDGVKETYTGLQYSIDTLGTGVIPTSTDSVKISFTGQLYNGTYFTSSTATLLVEEQIAGMQEGLKLMPEGSVFDLWIPYYLAYGSDSHSYYYDGNLVSISSYSMLHFHVILKKVYQNVVSED